MSIDIERVTDPKGPPPQVRIKPDPISGPIVVHSRADIASLLAAQRVALGMTCEELDAHAGFSDRYAAKLEHGDKPSGRQGFHISLMAEVWLEALKVRLVLMPVELAESMGAVMAPKKAAA